MRRLFLLFLFLQGLNLNVSYGQQRLSMTIDSFSTHKISSYIPQNLYYQQSGIMCKKECQIQSLLKTNVFLRLGSKEYVDGLERKPSSFIGKKD
jgi:hypothetical protein